MPFPGVGPLIVGRGSGGAFSPFDEPGMLAWWNSENTNLDGGDNVISYLDVSGNGIAATSASAPQRPTTTFGDPTYGGLPFNSWSNAADTLVISDILSLGAYTLVQVCHIPASINAYLLSMSAGDYVYGNIGDSLYTLNRDGSGPSAWNANAGAGWFNTVAPQVFVRRMNGTHAGDTIRMNGVDVPMVSAAADDPGTGIINTLFAMMAYYVGGAAVDGTWVTSLLYDHAVTDPVTLRLESYFRTYYSI